MDIASLTTYIGMDCKAPQTAKSYIDALYVRIKWLENNANIFPIIPELSLQMGFSIRRINFGKMAILYSVEDDIVYVHRVIPQSLVIY